jgi:hypothetical protein
MASFDVLLAWLVSVVGVGKANPQMTQMFADKTVFICVHLRNLRISLPRTYPLSRSAGAVQRAMPYNPRP